MSNAVTTSSLTLTPEEQELSTKGAETTIEPEGQPPPKDFRFWVIIGIINLSYFFSLLEASSISTALPTITASLHGGDFIWVCSAYNIASTAFMPISGGLAQAFGRRIALLTALPLFGIGSLICGIAPNLHVLITGRVIQGSGSAGLTAISSIILSDIVSLRERGTYNGLLQLTWFIAAGIGPCIGGALARRETWRWLFYLNIPIVVLTIILVLLFLDLKAPEGGVRENLAMMDWLGNFLIVSGSVSTAIGLTWGGVTYPWSSAQVLVPLCIGISGITLFFVYEIKWCTKAPIVPYEAIANRTSLSGYLQIFFNGVAFMAFVFYIPVYFQACHGSSPLFSGVQLLPLSFSVAPFSILTGLSVTRTGLYRPQCYVGWVICIISLGLFSTVHADTALSLVLFYEVLVGIGFGIIYSATYFPVLAPLSVEVTPEALAFYAFLREFAMIWAMTIGGTVLQNYIPGHLPSSLSTSGGSAGGDLGFYELIRSLGLLPEPERMAARDAIGEGLRRAWVVMAGIVALGFVTSFGMRGLTLSGELDKKWGVEDKEKKGGGVLPEGEERKIDHF